MGPTINRTLLLLSALAGLSAVALGAFGAHALGDQLTEKQIGWWDTATFYLLTHAVAGLAIAFVDKAERLAFAAMLMVGGAVLFATTLFAMALGAPIWLGATTPIGGIAMVIGWAMIAISALRSR